MKKGKKNSKSEDEHSAQAVGAGRYRRKEPPSPHVADYSSSIVRHPTAVKRSDTGPGNNKSARSLSVPSLHHACAKVKYSPPTSPHKQRSKSVRVNAAKKASSFKRSLKKFFGPHLELDENGIGLDEQRVVGTYRPLNYSRPRSIGGSSDCSNSSSYTADFSRCNSMRESNRSRISHTDNVFQGARQASCDSNDYYPIHVASGSTDSSLRQLMHYPYRGIGGENMQRSSSSTSLKNFGIQTKIGMTDPRYHSVATDIPYLEEHGSNSRNKAFLRHMIGRQGTSMEDTESLWEDSQSFTFVNKSVVPSDPEYRQVAEELMSASPTHKNVNEFVLDPRRMSDASIDPRRVSIDSGVESSVATLKRNRSLPNTPITQSFATAHPEMGPARECSATPHSYLSQDSCQSLPQGWDIAYTEQGLRYYLDHSSQSTHWDLPHNPDDALGLPTGWEAVRSGQYGTYYVNHNNKTAIYQHPYHARPPPPYQRPPNFEEEDPKLSRGDRKTPARSHSHRSSQSHRVLDQNSSLLRRSKSVRDQEVQNRGMECVSHERQLSVVTFVPPSLYQSKEIPQWLKEYVESPFGSELDMKMQSRWWKLAYDYDDLVGWGTMITRLLKKGCEQIVKAYEYYRVAIQQELEDRLRERHQYACMERQHQQAQQQLVNSNRNQSVHSLRQYHHGHHPPPHLHHATTYYQHTSATSLHQPHTLHSDLLQLTPSSTNTITTTTTTTLDPPPPSPHSPQLAPLHSQLQQIHLATPPSTHLPSSYYSNNPLQFNHFHENHSASGEGKYDTMIEKYQRKGPDLQWDGVGSFPSHVRSSSNGLRQDDSKGNLFGVEGMSQSTHPRAFPYRAVSTDHMPLPRQSSGLSEIFDQAHDMVQETFV